MKATKMKLTKVVKKGDSLNILREFIVSENNTNFRQPPARIMYTSSEF